MINGHNVSGWRQVDAGRDRLQKTPPLAKTSHLFLFKFHAREDILRKHFTSLDGIFIFLKEAGSVGRRGG